MNTPISKELTDLLEEVVKLTRKRAKAQQIADGLNAQISRLLARIKEVDK